MVRMNRLTRGFLIAALLLPLAAVAQVQHPRKPIPLTPQQQERYRALLPQLRCLVCQNESLAESQAALAADLRYEVRGLVARGDSKKQVKRYMVERYGDYVLLKPPFKAMTWLLWFGPFLIVLLALSSPCSGSCGASARPGRPIADWTRRS
jgi:Uncharacterized protein involved in biosynthesis of c-type cytochromes